ncbi:MAG: AMP-binding protein [Halioglobus sp.]
MPDLIHQFIAHRAQATPDAPALLFKDQCFTYAQLQSETDTVAAALLALGIGPGERVAVYLPKQAETVFSIFGAAAAGACFVPINPLLKPRQLAHILPHCNVRVLVTSAPRLESLLEILVDCPDLHTVVVVEDRAPERASSMTQQCLGWGQFLGIADTHATAHRRIDLDMTAILYTSGSTGNPKGVVLSHRNMVAGARSVASYLGNSSSDRLLAVLPLSFDAGLSQLTTAFSVGASVVLMDYLLPRDVLRAVARYRVTGLAAVLPCGTSSGTWNGPPRPYSRCATSPIPAAHARVHNLTLQQRLNTLIFLMWVAHGVVPLNLPALTRVSVRPESMGKAIPNAEILVINEAGQECAPGEPGELVHRGALVSLGY